MKKIFSLIILLALLLSLFAACKSDNISDNSNISGDESLNETSKEQDDFHLQKKNFGDVTIRVLTTNSTDYGKCEIAPEEINSEPVNDASFNRAKLIQEEYGITVEQVEKNSSDSLNDIVRNQVETGLDEYQVISAAIYYLSPLSVEGMFYDLSNIQSNNYIDFKQPYWDQAIQKDLSLMGSIYYATGDIVVTDDEATWAVYFNKDIANEAHIMDAYDYNTIYDLVEDGAWTLDTMHEMAKNATIQVSDTGLVFGTGSQDTWGLLCQCYDSYAFTAGCGECYIENDGSNLRISIGDESNVRAFDKVFNIMMDTSAVGVAEIAGKAAGVSTYYDDQTQIFANGKALFMPNRIGIVQNASMREAKIHYGLLPMPKFSKEQDSYASTETVYWCTALSIPLSNTEKFDATCYALELLAYLGQKYVTPEFYDRTLKNKRFEDDESVNMLDMIFRNRTYDMGAVFNFGEMLYFYTNQVVSQQNTHMSTLEKNIAAYQNAIDLFLDQIQFDQK